MLATGCAGVAGGGAAAAAAAGAAAGLGYLLQKKIRQGISAGPRDSDIKTHLVYHADYKALLLDVVGLNSIVIFQDFA